MSRVLGIEMRRSAAFGVALVVLAGGTGLLWFARDNWTSGWMSLAMAQRQYLFLVLPLALAGGAWQARREQTSRVAELFASTPRPRAQRSAPLLIVLAAGVAVAYVLTTALAGALIAGTASYLPAAAFGVLAVGVLAVVGAVWLGLAVGRLVPSLVTAPALAVAGILLLTLVYEVTGRREWLAMLLAPTHGMGQYTAYQTVPLRVSAAQAVWLLAVAAGAAMLYAASRRRTRTAALLPALLGLAAGLLLIPRGDAYVTNPVDAVAREQVCTTTEPRVCVTRVHEGLLADAEPLARESLTLLAKLPGAPVRAEEDTPDYFGSTVPVPQDPATVRLDIRTRSGGHLDTTDFAARTLFLAGVRQHHCSELPDEAVGVAAASWLAGRILAEPVIPPETVAEASRLVEVLRALPEPEAAARVAEVRSAALECRGVTGILDGTAAR